MNIDFRSRCCKVFYKTAQPIMRSINNTMIIIILDN